MVLKGLFRNKSASFQMLVLLSLLIAGALVSSLIGMRLVLFEAGATQETWHDANSLRIIQLISAIGTFLLPALLLACLCSNQPAAYLSTNRYPSAKAWRLTAYSIVLLSPTITLLGLLNKAITLPSFMRPLEVWMQKQEAMAEQLTQLLLADNSPSILLFNMLVIAVAAGITEEFLFRGALQRVVERWTANPHTVIWTVAVLFSAVHMQFYGFIPRLLLGAYFGYLLYWSKSIWLPVFAHFTNNALAVIALSFDHLKENSFISGEIPREEWLSFCIVVAITLTLSYACIRGLRKCLLA